MRTALQGMLVVTALVAPSTAAQTRLRVLISVDMEGVVGTVSGSFAPGPGGWAWLPASINKSMR